MDARELKQRIIAALPRDLILDLWDVAVARARQAQELVRDHTDLEGRSARGLEGQARFRLMEKGFEDACLLHGGRRLEGDVIPGTELRFFQPFMRFGIDCPGVLLGLASMPSSRELPAENMSRKAGVTLNYQLTPRLDFEGTGGVVRPGDIFAALLFARDPTQPGRIEEVAIGLIDAEYTSFLFYEPVESFLAGYSGLTGEPDPEDGNGGPGGGGTLVTLKKSHRAFRAPGTPDAGDKSGTDE